MTTFLFFKRLKTISPIQIFILLVVIFATVFIVKFYGKEGQGRLIRVQVIGKDWSASYDNQGFRPPYWLVESVNEGDVELSEGGGKIAEVVKVESYKRPKSDYDLYLTLMINGVQNKRVNKYIYKGRAIEVGAPVTLRLNNSLLIAQVIDDHVPMAGYETVEVIATARIRNAEPWVLTSLKAGDMVTNGKRGDIVAEILSISTEPAQSQLVPGGGQAIIFQRNPRLVDVVLSIKLLAENHGRELYFGVNQNIKVGSTLSLSFPEVDLPSIEIVAIKELTADEKSK